MKLPREVPMHENAANLARAAASLYEKVHSGTYKLNGKKRAIAGDLTKLKGSDSLSPMERLLLGSYAKVTKKISGTQQIRRTIGHAMFGFRIMYGEGTFLTITPNRRHSSLLLRLARARKNDRSLICCSDETSKWRSTFADPDVPDHFLAAEC